MPDASSWLRAGQDRAPDLAKRSGRRRTSSPAESRRGSRRPRSAPGGVRWEPCRPRSGLRGRDRRRLTRRPQAPRTSSPSRHSEPRMRHQLAVDVSADGDVESVGAPDGRRLLRGQDPRAERVCRVLAFADSDLQHSLVSLDVPCAPVAEQDVSRDCLACLGRCQIPSSLSDNRCDLKLEVNFWLPAGSSMRRWLTGTRSGCE